MKKTIFVILSIFIAIQLIRPNKTNPTIDTNITLKAPDEVLILLKKACYDCHSYETIWPTYSHIAPMSWSIVAHVNDGRKALNFSTYKEIDNDTKIERLKRAIKTVNNGMMPPPNYIHFHDKAILSDKEKSILNKWFKKELEL
jgi:hypothetical protein